MRCRLVRADIEGEIDMDLDPGPTTFCYIPRFVPRWYRGVKRGIIHRTEKK